MRTVLRLAGLRFVIYPNDHPPAHVHVIGDGWIFVVNLLDLEIREAIRCEERTARRVLELLTGRRDSLLDSWRRYHG